MGYEQTRAKLDRAMAERVRVEAEIAKLRNELAGEEAVEAVSLAARAWPERVRDAGLVERIAEQMAR